MRVFPTIQVIIPTYNNGSDLDATVQSILAQDYDESKILLLFVDFGSTDGTKNKLLHYRREWAGVFSLAGVRDGRTMRAKSLLVSEQQYSAAENIIICPGEILYPHCFRVLASWMRRGRRYLCEQGRKPFLLSEADILEDNGTIRKQTPLYSRPCILRAYSEDCYEYVKKGYRHIIMPFGHADKSMDKVGTLKNLASHWNHLAYRGFYEDVVYINEPLACVKVREPEDTLDDLLFSYEQALTMFRLTQELPDFHATNDNFEYSCRGQQAKYALWRSFILHGRGHSKEAEDCFLMARIICPTIIAKEYWLRMERLLLNDDDADRQWLTSYFEYEEPAESPRWPLDGPFARARHTLRQRFSRERRTKFSSW